ncbi:hypothetical protein DIPPA_16489 [Diplonema papillatum]|nr:hypothetical protein DIPPA_16489 [Diplonema papillatum]
MSAQAREPDSSLVWRIVTKSAGDAKGSDKMSEDEFRAWYKKAKEEAAKRSAEVVPAGAGNNNNNAANANNHNINNNNNNNHHANNNHRHHRNNRNENHGILAYFNLSDYQYESLMWVVDNLWTMTKCAFLAFVLAYDGSGMSLSFVLAAVLLFTIHLLQNWNVFRHVVVVREQRLHPEEIDDEGDDPNDAPADADDANAAANPAEPPGALQPLADNANAVANQGAPADRPRVQAAQPLPSFPKLALRLVIVFVESILPSWTLRELDRFD